MTISRPRCGKKVQDQLGRIKLLADLDQYDSARLELREGAALGLRRDLRGAEEDYIAIKGEVSCFAASPLLFPQVQTMA